MKNSSVRSACGAQISQDHQEELVITWGVLIPHLPSGAIFTPRFPGIQFLFLGNHLAVEGVPTCGREVEWHELEAPYQAKPFWDDLTTPTLCHCISTSSITSLTIICSDKKTLQLKSLPRTQSVVWLRLICVIYQKGRAMNAHKNHYTK